MQTLKKKLLLFFGTIGAAILALVATPAMATPPNTNATSAMQPAKMLVVQGLGTGAMYFSAYDQSQRTVLGQPDRADVAFLLKPLAGFSVTLAATESMPTVTWFTPIASIAFNGGRNSVEQVAINGFQSPHGAVTTVGIDRAGVHDIGYLGTKTKLLS